MAARLRTHPRLHQLKRSSPTLQSARWLQPYPISATTQFRSISTPPSPTTSKQLQATPPAKQAAGLGTLPLTWPHKGWEHNAASEVVPGHRAPRNLSDKLAWWVVRSCRWGMDWVTGMGPASKITHGKKVTIEKPMTEAQWMVRFIFLESIAGVPGIVAGTLRHLHSIRRFKPDQGWIKTLLEESYNERMHLLTFLEMYQPGKFMRLMVLASQGIFYNALFFAYLISPRFVHRFVGYLEEEAVHTYTRCIQEIDRGLLPKWADKNFKIPEVAVTYWNMPEGRRTMRDLVLYVRADEASHRGVNHTLGNLDQLSDPNPFIDAHLPVSHMALAAKKPEGMERDEVLARKDGFSQASQ
ncbi:mitochondrial alternative oxidase [Podospora australis]|uniref:Alternative oxidase n=1 Tax=Podospora australis TaxID=1536484 RepID=A0AAN6WK12_9PEZI|nr:mitochondrial alternative oxidase [Podospora australis]